MNIRDMIAVYECRAICGEQKIKAIRAIGKAIDFEVAKICDAQFAKEISEQLINRIPSREFEAPANFTIRGSK